MITEISPTAYYQYRSASGTVRCRINSQSDDGKATLSFLTDGKWVPSAAKIAKAHLITFLNQNGGKEIEAPVATEVEAGAEVEAAKAQKPKVPRIAVPKTQTGPSTQDLCLGVLATGPKTTGEAARELEKPTAAVNSAMGALERAGKVSSVKGEADGKSFITWSLV